MAGFNTVVRYRLPPLVVVTLLGTSSGLPLILAGGTLQAWLKGERVGLEWIGLFALSGTPYLFKFLWAPLLDRFHPPFGGRRRGWIVLMVLALMATFGLLAHCHPTTGLWPMALLALLAAFFSASADINIDALRVELLPPRLAGLGASLHWTGLRMAMLGGAALALALSDRVPWRTVYLVMLLGLLPGAVAALLAPEPEAAPPPRTLRDAALGPFTAFFGRPRALEVLAFMLLFKLGDSLASALNIPFLMDVGFSRSEIAVATQTFGLGALLVGGVAGGWLLNRYPLPRMLGLMGGLQVLGMVATAALARGGRSPALMVLVMVLENSIYAMGMVAQLALIQRLCDPGRAATQFAFLTCLSALSRVLFATPAGLLAQRLGWPAFFLLCAALALPGLLLLTRYRRWHLPSPVPRRNRSAP